MDGVDARESVGAQHTDADAENAAAALGEVGEAGPLERVRGVCGVCGVRGDRRVPAGYSLFELVNVMLFTDAFSNGSNASLVEAESVRARPRPGSELLPFKFNCFPSVAAAARAPLVIITLDLLAVLLKLVVLVVLELLAFVLLLVPSSGNKDLTVPQEEEEEETREEDSPDVLA